MKGSLLERKHSVPFTAKANHNLEVVPKLRITCGTMPSVFTKFHAC
jgi:hypothetical protein